MVDPLRHELTQVARQCKEIILRVPDINKILNGKYQEVIAEYKRDAAKCDAPPPKKAGNKKSRKTKFTSNSLDEIALPPAQVVAENEQEPHNLEDK